MRASTFVTAKQANAYVSRLGEKLEAYGYISRKRTEEGNITSSNF